MRELRWVSSAKSDLLEFPGDVVREIGHDLYVAQLGDKPRSAKPLKGFGGAGVLEIIEDYDGDTYRAVYTVKFADVSTCYTRFKRNLNPGFQRRQKK